MVNTKHAFWQALFAAILIFGIGILVGVYYENSRTNKVEENLLYSEINLLDSQLLGAVGDNFNVSCVIEKQNIISFADKIYNEAKLLEEYDSSSQLTGTLQIIHRRYDLLRVLLWGEIINYNEKCGEKLKTVVYMYDYGSPDSSTKAEQIAFGRYLDDLKSKYGNRFILIPVAGDLNLGSVDLIKANYGITKLPVVIVNEKDVIGIVDNLFNIEKLLFE
jgi:hypothetical protein